jgi:hypothetical protein
VFFKKELLIFNKNNNYNLLWVIYYVK